MSLVAELTYGLKQLIAAQGGTITFRHRTTLSGPNPAPNPPTYIALVVDGLTALGASLINMRTDPTQGGVFTGRLIAGDTFTVSGDPAIYTVSAPAISPSGVDTVPAVPFTPPLVQAAPDGAAVSLAFVADAANIPASITGFSQILIDGSTVQEADRRIRFLASSLPGVTPRVGDLVMVEELASEVIAAAAMEIDGIVYGRYLHVRA